MTPALLAFAALDPDRDWDAYLSAMRLPCPWCRARPAEMCHQDGRPLTQGDRMHPSRARAGAVGATE